MKLTGKDLLITAFSIAAMSAAGTALYYDFTGKLNAEKTERIGTITFKKKTAQRKYSGQVIWENLNQTDAVYNYDTIRTDADSLSIIKLKDGSQIELNENTLILLSLTENKTTIDFSQGSINAAGAANLNIKAGNTVITAGNSTINLSKNTADQLNLNVNSGVAALGDKKIGENQEAVIGAGTAEVSDREFIPGEPRSGAYILAFSGEKNIRFAWTSKTVKKYLLEIARDPSFREKLISRTVIKPESMVRLKPGTYFWRIGYAEKKGKMSLPQPFIIIREREEHLIAPADLSAFNYVNTLPLIPLQWSGSTVASSYTISLAADPGFKNIIKTISTGDNSIAVDGLSAGTYYWQVTNVYPFPDTGLSVKSPARSFIIKQGTTVKPPEPMNPPDGQRISSLFLAGGMQLFNWQPGDDMKKYVIKIDRDREFKKPVISAATSQSFYQLSGGIATGTYFWRIEGIDAGGIPHASAERSFIITDAEKITTVSPADGGIVSVTDNRDTVQFTWNDPNRGRMYRLELSDKSDFSRILSSHASTATSLSAAGIPRGTFYWRVSLMDKKGKALLRSNIASARSTDVLESPASITPADGTAIDMTFSNTITFSWKKVPSATHYRIIVSHYSGGFSKKILETETTDTTYVLRQLELLDEGNFTWEIKALRYAGNKLENESPLRKNYFSITLQSGMEKPEIISPKNLYIK